MSPVLVLHGPNLNLLGLRETSFYGELSLSEINDRIAERANDYSLDVSFFQSNAEEALIQAIHQAYERKVEFIIINPAAFTHTSIALRDALLAVDIPFVEVHLSNVFSRENFRQNSYLSDIAKGVMTGLGWQSYLFALEFCNSYLKSQTKR